MESLIPLDYASLRLLWWGLLGLLLIGFAVMDGFDLGIAALLPVLGRSDTERRVVLAVVGPVWEGNQVWLITAGGSIFAAWPMLYAVSFSGFYLAMMLVLLALILRPLGFKYRSKLEAPRWRARWDAVLCGSGVIAPLVFGIAVGNVVLGLPWGLDAASLRPRHEGGLIALLHPFALLCGVLALSLFVLHGASLIAWRTDDPIAARARRSGVLAALLSAALFIAGGFWVRDGIAGHTIVSAIDPQAWSDPLAKTVALRTGAWLDNFHRWPALWIAPAAGVAGALLAGALLRAHRAGAAFLASATAIIGVILTVGLALFPFILPSSLQPAAGLTVWDASSSRLTLWIMLLATAILLPLVMLYTAWVYRVMRGKVTDESVSDPNDSY